MVLGSRLESLGLLAAGISSASRSAAMDTQPPADDKTKASGTLCESQNTICVGGVDKNYNKGWFSRDGKFIDIWAPGSDIALSLSTAGP
ncbi:hypothetical protein FSST1_012610 [Fusarium sambucinum]